MRVKILDRYILQKFWVILIISLITFLAVFHIVDVIEKIDKFLRATMALSAVGTYYLYQLPFFINIALPMSVLLATVFTIGMLSKNNELAAIKSSGISLYRVSVPLLAMGILLSAFSYFFDDTLVIPASRKRIEIEQTQMKRYKKRKKKIIRNITYQDSPVCNIVIDKFSTTNKTASTVTIQYTDEHILTRRVDSEKMKWDKDSKVWILSDFKIRYFDNEGNETVVTHTRDSLLTLNLKPEDIVSANLKPDEMRFGELSSFIQRLRQSGNDPRKWEVNLHFKISFAFTNFIVILFGIPLSAIKQHKGVSFGAGMSLFVIFTYYGFIKFGQVLGYKGFLSPFFSVWFGNIVFFIAGLYLLYKIRQ